MLKYQIIHDLFILCAVFAVAGLVLYRLTRSVESAQGEAQKLGALDLLVVAGIFLLYFGLHSQDRPGAHPPDAQRLSVLALVVSMTLQMVLAGMVVAVLAARVDLVSFLGLRWPAWRWIFVLAPAGLLATWVFLWGLDASGYIQWVEQLLKESPVQEAVLVLQTSKDGLLLGVMAVAVVVVAPLAEEMLFRGYLYPVLKRFSGVSFGCVMSGLIFATAHQELAALPSLFFLGVLLALLYERSGSIWAPIGMHALFNATTVVLSLVPRFFPELRG